MIYGIFLVSHLAIPLPMLFLVRFSLKYISIIGFLLIVSSVLILVKRSSDLWANYYYSISLSTSVAMISIYGCHFAYEFFGAKLDPDFIKWIGVVN